MVKLAIVETRFKIVCEVPEPATYEALCYQIDIRDTLLNSTKHYIGWHAGSVEDIENQKYLHSSKCPELEQAIENPNNIITYNIISFGSTNEMATLEHTELAKVHAITNSSYFNKSNGGGRYVLNLSKQQNNIDNIMNNISLNKYPIEFYNKSKLEKLGSHQVRLQQLDTAHVNNLKDKMKIISEALPDPVTGERLKIDPIVILMSKDKDGKSKIIGGNHSRAACLGVPLMNGLDAIEVPYKDWCNLAECDIVTLGLLLNPMEEKVRLPNNLDDIANWIVNCIEDHKLYKNVLPLHPDVKDPWWDHHYIEKYIDGMNILKNQKRPLIQKAKKIYEERTGIKPGINLINWHNKALLNTPDIQAWYNAYCDSKKALLNYDEIIKVSSERFLWEQIADRVIKYDIAGNITLSYPKHLLVLVYLPLNYDTSVAAKEGWECQLKRWNEFEYPSFSDKMTIDLEMLPRTTDKIVLPS